MTLQTSGPISIADISNEFTGDSRPNSLSEFYRRGPRVPDALDNLGIPISGTISVGDFYGGRGPLTLEWEIIGGGGGGGGGDDAPYQSNFRPAIALDGLGETGEQSYFRVLDFPNGLDQPSQLAFESVVNGGTGGISFDINEGTDPHPRGTDGEASFYGPGGLGGDGNLNGENAPSGSYGAAGGGAGGDRSGYGDAAGPSGRGGFAGQRTSGTTVVKPGSRVEVFVGSGGTGEQVATYNGGNGQRGYFKGTIVETGLVLEQASTGNKDWTI